MVQDPELWKLQCHLFYDGSGSKCPADTGIESAGFGIIELSLVTGEFSVEVIG